MHHPKLLRSKCIRSAMIPAALLSAILSGCAEQQATGPNAPRVVSRSYDVPFNKFFIAWSQSYSSGPIQTQIFAIDTRLDRQYAPWTVDESVLSFARANPGRLYINGDEPDQACLAASDYAVIYHDFVVALRGADPTARVSPAGFAEPNHHCCPSEDVYEPCWSNIHGLSYAGDFYNAYVQRYGVAPPVNEWRFHDFGLPFPVGDMDGWWSRVESEASWSVSHGANMVLGAWGFMAWRESPAAFQEHLKQAIGRLINDKRINGAVYWSYQPWIDSPHYLANEDGSLTPEGQTFVNPLTDIPTGVEIESSANGSAKLRWSNPTSAWAAEAEFWVQPRGSNSFVYRNTQLVAGPGGNETPAVVFNRGDSVKARVRYYNAYGQAAWSSFSNALYMKPPTSTKSTGKGPLFCLLQLC
jgi:hypothetical protein